MDFENSLMSVSHIRTTGWCTVKTPKQSEQTGTGKILLYHVKSKGGGGGEGRRLWYSQTVQQKSAWDIQQSQLLQSVTSCIPCLQCSHSVISPVYNAHTLSYPLFTMFTLCHIPCLQCLHYVLSPVYNVYTVIHNIPHLQSLIYNVVSYIYNPKVCDMRYPSFTVCHMQSTQRFVTCNIPC